MFLTKQTFFDIDTISPLQRQTTFFSWSVMVSAKTNMRWSEDVNEASCLKRGFDGMQQAITGHAYDQIWQMRNVNKHGIPFCEVTLVHVAAMELPTT